MGERSLEHGLRRVSPLHETERSLGGGWHHSFCIGWHHSYCAPWLHRLAMVFLLSHPDVVTNRRGATFVSRWPAAMPLLALRPSALPTMLTFSNGGTMNLSSSGSALGRDATVMTLVGMAHGISHFSQLLLAPLFPWLKAEFGVTYAQLGLLMSIFFVVSCAMQAASGFVVDRVGPRPILFAGLGALGAAAFGFALSSSYAMLALFSVLAGVGNGVFHPADFTLLNRKIEPSRLGHAFSVHNITGSLGWALAPAMLVSLTLAFSWRTALACAGGLVWAVLAVLWLHRDKLALEPMPVHKAERAGAGTGGFDFLRIPAVWMCFAFFLFYAMALSGVQAFAPEAARLLHHVPTQTAAACLTVYMVCSAGGMVWGGFLAADAARCERIVGVGFGIAASMALVVGLADIAAMAVPVAFGVMGFGAGIAAPSRDLLVKRSAPPNATGRVYGVVYSGLDIGQALAPLLFGGLMDLGRPAWVWLGIALVQGVLIASAFNVTRARRSAMAPA